MKFIVNKERRRAEGPRRDVNVRNITAPPKHTLVNRSSLNFSFILLQLYNTTRL